MHKTIYALPLAIIAASVLFGCGGDDNAVFNSGSGGSGDDGSGGSGDGGTGGSGNSSGSGGDWGHTDGGSGGGTGGNGGTDSGRYGYVTLTQSKADYGTGINYSHYAWASFTEIVTPGSYDCDIKSDGPCTITRCTTGSTIATFEYRNAGQILITGGNKPVTLEFDHATGNYAYVTAQELLWSDGATLNVSAAGAEVSAFSTSVSGVAQARLTSPAYPGAGSMLEVGAGKPFSLQWLGANTGKITVSFTWNAEPQSTSISCVFDASSGSGTIPASAMGMFTAGQTGTGSVMGGDTKIVDVPGWNVSVYTRMMAAHTNGVLAAWQVAYK
ncbi:MAG: hypothetical protein FWD57_06580 [Polyangiaceae bacterium]|nr:hypothetical protein [Polyangiaceae bacterium]